MGMSDERGSSRFRPLNVHFGASHRVFSCKRTQYPTAVDGRKKPACALVPAAGGARAACELPVRVLHTTAITHCTNMSGSTIPSVELMNELRPLTDELKIDAHLVELEAMGFTIGAMPATAGPSLIIKDATPAHAPLNTVTGSCRRMSLCRRSMYMWLHAPRHTSTKW